MTVQELVRLLANYPSDMRVVIDGYESGFDDIEPHRVLVCEIRLDAGEAWYEGRHREIEDTRSEGTRFQNALVIHRAS